EHAVEYLHHVKRRGKQGDVQGEARRGGEQHERSKVLREQPTHGRALPETCANPAYKGAMSPIFRFEYGWLPLCMRFKRERGPRPGHPMLRTTHKRTL